MITRAGWSVSIVAVLLCVVGIAGRYAELIAVGTAGMVAMSFAIGVTWRKHSLAVERELETYRAAIGATVANTLVVTNLAKRRTGALTLVDRVGTHNVNSPVQALPPLGSQVVETVLPTTRRGILPVGPVGIHRSDPLGLIRRVRSYGEVAELRVHPRIVPVQVPQIGMNRSLDGEGSNETRGDMQFDSLREYVPGDDVRRIHWRSSARSSTVLIREHIDICQPVTTVVVDTSASTWPDERSFEEAIAAATSLVCSSVQAGHPTIITDLTNTVGPDRPVGEYLDFSAGLELQDSKVDLAALPTRLPATTVNDLVIVFSGALGQDKSREIVQATKRWRHCTVVLFPGHKEPIVPAGLHTLTCATVTDFARAWSMWTAVAT